MVDMSGEGMFTSIIRSIFASLDSFVYKLLAGIYNVFFNVATADVLKAELVKNLFGRIQIILGVIILFKLVISFFSGVVDPDSLNDKKNGVGSVIKRVVVVLVMLLMIVPLNIPEANTGEEGMGSWNKNMNTHGILFGSLYELQRRILKDNIIFKAINGNSGGMSETTRTNVGESFAKDVLKTFLTVNVVYDGADFSDQCEGKNDYRDTNCVCTRWKNEARTDADSDINVVYPVYFDPDSTIDMLLQSKVVTAYCDDNSDEMSYAALQEEGKDFDERATTKFNDDTYALSYSYLWSTIIGVLFCVLILSLTIDVAVRLFKLVLLQIISPVAILSYIDPSSEKTFKNWTKSLTETYLSVFIRVAIISLILFIVNNISLTGFGLNISNGFVGFVSKILIYFGLIMFAKEAPKFITQSLGIENKDGGGLFSGVGKMMAGASIGLGAVGSFHAGRRASIMADQTNDVQPKHWWTKAGNHGKHVLSGITGSASGTATGLKALGEAKDHYIKNTRQAMQQRNANAIQQGASGSTGFGRFKSSTVSMITGESPANRNDREIAAAESRKSALEAIKSRVSGEMVKYNWTSGKAAMPDGKGGTIYMKDVINKEDITGDINYKDFMARKNAAASQGRNVFDINTIDANGNNVIRRIDMVTANQFEGLILKNNEDSYIREVVNGHQIDNELLSLINDANAKGGAYTKDGRGSSGGIINSRDSYIKTAEGLGQEIRDAKRANSKAKADDLYANKK